MTAAVGAARAQTIADLRARIARLGGLPGHPAPVRRPSVLRVEDDAGPVPPGTRTLGFVPTATPSGVVWVRRVTVDVLPFLERAAAPAPADADQLLRLVHPTAAPEADGDDGGAARAMATHDRRVVVLDIESLGLRGSGVVPFLVGVGTARGHHLDVDQYLLVDPGAEAAMLAEVAAAVQSADRLLTYNGRTFDMPVLVARSIVNRMSPAAFEVRVHCDLLSPVRRLFRDRLGTCTLRQAEASLLGLERVDDVPGAEAPMRYRTWLRGGGAEVLAGVVRHNQQDLCSTLVLAARLAAHVDGVLVEPVHPADRYHLGVHLERRGVEEEAHRHYRATLHGAGAPWDRRAGHRLAGRLRRTTDAAARAEATAILDRLWRADPGDLRGARALAVALEREGRFDAAHVVCLRSLEECRRLGAMRLGLMRHAPASGWEADWERRRDRLVRRLQAAARPRRRSAARPVTRAREPAIAGLPLPV